MHDIILTPAQQCSLSERYKAGRQRIIEFKLSWLGIFLFIFYLRTMFVTFGYTYLAQLLFDADVFKEFCKIHIPRFFVIERRTNLISFINKSVL